MMSWSGFGFIWSAVHDVAQSSNQEHNYQTELLMFKDISIKTNNQYIKNKIKYRIQYGLVTGTSSFVFLAKKDGLQYDSENSEDKTTVLLTQWLTQIGSCNIGTFAFICKIKYSCTRGNTPTIEPLSA